MQGGGTCAGGRVAGGAQQQLPCGPCVAQRACHHAIDYLMKFGYSDIQAYMILGSAPIEGRFSGVVDIPNSCATVYIPRRIFDFDVAPGTGKPHQVATGTAVPKSAT